MTSLPAMLARTEGPRLAGVRVLLVDDSRTTLGAIAAALEHFGATVTAVDTAHRALEVLEGTRPDVLISDLEMPGRGGYWLIGQVRALPPERGGATPAAALTGLTGPQHRAAALRAGFQHHLEKPVALPTLVSVTATLALEAQAGLGAHPPG